MLHAIQAVMYWSGSAAAYARLLRTRGAVILMYHSVSDRRSAPWVFPRNQLSPRVFERQLRFLARRRRVVSLTRLAEMLEENRDPEAGTVVLTFDDGYVDNRDTAAPILERFGLPATLFLPTDYVNNGETNWADRMHCMITWRTRNRITMPGPEGVAFDLSKTADLGQFTQAIGAKLLSLDRGGRERLLGELEAQLCPARRPPRLTLTWDEVRDLTERFPLFDIGGHTVNHLDLSACDLPTATREIVDCKRTIESELGRRVEHFSFPYSRSTDRTCTVVRDAGYRSAVAAGRGEVRADCASPRFALPRVEAPESPSRFRFYTGGAYPGLSRALTGRS
jgi:peptidoglycan/xylan/chitin deacetylase (PgdA/CDA1 family)